jgi:hypothetical protein
MPYPQMERNTYAIAENRDLIARVHTQRRVDGETRHGTVKEALFRKKIQRDNFLVFIFSYFPFSFCFLLEEGDFQLRLRNEKLKGRAYMPFFDSSLSVAPSDIGHKTRD